MCDGVSVGSASLNSYIQALMNVSRADHKHIFKNIYFWLHGVLASAQAFSSCGGWELLSSCGEWASHCDCFSCYRAQSLRVLGLQQLWSTGLVVPRHGGFSWTKN